MPLQFSAAHSSRITKTSQRRNPLLKRSLSSPFNEYRRRKPIERSKSSPNEPADEEELSDGVLEDAKPVRSLADGSHSDDTVAAMQHARSHMFEALPDGGGFNSVRIAEILNYRKSLPPMVTIAHVHALTPSPTRTEKEIATLVKVGKLRRLKTPGRGTGGSSIGDGLCTVEDFGKLIQEMGGLSKDLRDRFMEHACKHSTEADLMNVIFSSTERISLMRAGLLTTPSQYQNTTNVLSGFAGFPGEGMASIASASRAASGSLEAVGGDGAVNGAGGRGGIRRSDSEHTLDSAGQSSSIVEQGPQMQVSMPGTGSYLKLVSAARSHLLSLVHKSKSRSIPAYLLRERWDGGVPADDPSAKAKKYRGEFVGVLPARTRKWKQFYGLSFDWVLAECLGAGLVELFDTKSVGLAVRIS